MSDEPIHSAEEQCRVQERLLVRGNTLGGVIAAVLTLIRNGKYIDPDELRRYENELCGWTADVRAVASEEAP